MAAASNGDVYAAVALGDIYKQSGGTGNFNALSQTNRLWSGMAATPNGDVYACVNGGDIYKQTSGTGNFAALSQTPRVWNGMAAAPNGDIYACVYGGDIYKLSTTPNLSGGPLYLDAGLGKGTGQSRVIVRTGAKQSSGTTMQPLTDRLTIDEDGTVTSTGPIVLPAPGTAALHAATVGQVAESNTAVLAISTNAANLKGAFTRAPLPSGSNTIDFGSAAYPWRTGYFDTVRMSSNSLWLGATHVTASPSSADVVFDTPVGPGVVAYLSDLPYLTNTLKAAALTGSAPYASVSNAVRLAAGSGLSWSGGQLATLKMAATNFVNIYTTADQDNITGGNVANSVTFGGITTAGAGGMTRNGNAITGLVSGATYYFHAILNVHDTADGDLLQCAARWASGGGVYYGGPNGSVANGTRAATHVVAWLIPTNAISSVGLNAFTGNAGNVVDINWARAGLWRVFP
jgi:hypothetical protein